jgi:ribonuclease-3
MVICSAKPVTHNNHLYGNALEALIGAIYLDQGYEKCVQFVKHKIIDKYINLEEVARKELNFKSVLLEWCQKHKVEVSFNLIESFVDNDGNPIFQTEIVIAERQIGVGIGFSKKESHQKAAQMAVKKIRTDKEFKEYIKAYKAAKNDPSASTEELSDIIDETTLANGNTAEPNTEEKD